MTAEGAYAYGGVGRDPAAKGHVPPDPAVLLGAVREDIRQTLRTGWIDPVLEAAAASPAFLTAAWSAVRPNVSKSFLLLSRAVRTEAGDSARATLSPPDLRRRLHSDLSEEEFRRAEESVRAAHLAMAKVQIVSHILYRAVRRERLAGTGREEPPVRRGVPDWQRWMSFQPAPEESRNVLDHAVALHGLPGPPTPLRLLARWPPALIAVWDELGQVWGAEAWRGGTIRLRRTILAGLRTLPHPVELQWTALLARGFTETDRAGLAEVLASHDASMASQTLAAAFIWLAFGAPEVGVEA